MPAVSSLDHTPMRSGSPQGVFGDLYGVAGAFPPYAVITSGGPLDALVCVNTCVDVTAQTAAHAVAPVVKLSNRLFMSCSFHPDLRARRPPVKARRNALSFSGLGGHMDYRKLTVASLAVAVLVVYGAVRRPMPVSADGDLTSVNAGLKSAGALAFGPDGVLFVGDSMGGAVAALETGDRTASSGANVDVKGIDEKIAALVGVMPSDLLINDVAVNPISKNVYVSAARGRGPDATPIIVRVEGSGKLTMLPLDTIKHETVSLADAPASSTAGRQNPRTQTITDMAFVNGNLMVAGMSNEEWSSALRSIPYPFKTANKGTQLQIWHSSHGRYETQSPVRTFVPYTIDGKDYVLAAYTCTPLVKIPVSDLKAGAQVKGVTIADLGAGNQPLDMVPYTKDGHQ